MCIYLCYSLKRSRTFLYLNHNITYLFSTKIHNQIWSKKYQTTPYRTGILFICLNCARLFIFLSRPYDYKVLNVTALTQNFIDQRCPNLERAIETVLWIKTHISKSARPTLKAHNAFIFLILINKLSYLITYAGILNCTLDQVYLSIFEYKHIT